MKKFFTIICGKRQSPSIDEASSNLLHLKNKIFPYLCPTNPPTNHHSPMPTTNPSTLHPNPSAAALPYNPALSLWLSVDPLSDKYPNLSPYVYCANNPVRLRDPDGRTVVIPGEDDRNYINQLIDPTSENYSKSFHDVYNELDTQKDHTYVFQSWNYDASRNGFEEGMYTNHGDGTSTINFTKGDSPMVSDPLIGASPFRNLFEETYHAYQDRGGNITNSCLTEAFAWKFSADAPGTTTHYLDNESGKVVTTLMGRIQNSSVTDVAWGFKFGFMPKETTAGTSFGVYRDFPLGTKQEMKLFFPCWPNL